MLIAVTIWYNGHSTIYQDHQSLNNLTGSSQAASSPAILSPLLGMNHTIESSSSSINEKMALIGTKKMEQVVKCVFMIKPVISFYIIAKEQYSLISLSTVVLSILAR